MTCLRNRLKDLERLNLEIATFGYAARLKIMNSNYIHSEKLKLAGNNIRANLGKSAIFKIMDWLIGILFVIIFFGLVYKVFEACTTTQGVVVGTDEKKCYVTINDRTYEYNRNGANPAVGETWKVKFGYVVHKVGD